MGNRNHLINERMNIWRCRNIWYRRTNVLYCFVYFPLPHMCMDVCVCVVPVSGFERQVLNLKTNKCSQFFGGDKSVFSFTKKTYTRENFQLFVMIIIIFFFLFWEKMFCTYHLKENMLSSTNLIHSFRSFVRQLLSDNEK